VDTLHALLRVAPLTTRPTLDGLDGEFQEPRRAAQVFRFWKLPVGAYQAPSGAFHVSY